MYKKSAQIDMFNGNTQNNSPRHPRYSTVCHRYSLKSNSESLDNVNLCLIIKLVIQNHMSKFQIYKYTHAFRLTIPAKTPKKYIMLTTLLLACRK